MGAGRGRGLLRAAGWSSIAAGAVHGVVTPSHFDEWWGYGLFFIGAGAAQVLYGLALLTDAIGPHSGPDWRRWHRRLLQAGVVGNVLVIVLYVFTRTVGVPYGPEAGEVEPVAAIDVLSKTVEVVLIGFLVALVRRTPTPVP